MAQLNRHRSPSCASKLKVMLKDFMIAEFCLLVTLCYFGNGINEFNFISVLFDNFIPFVLSIETTIMLRLPDDSLPFFRIRLAESSCSSTCPTVTLLVSCNLRSFVSKTVNVP